MGRSVGVAVHVPSDILIARHDQNAALYAYDIAIESLEDGRDRRW
jgi:hypothetical protein